MSAGAGILDRVRLYDKTYRIIPSSYPTIKIFEECVDPSELESLYELEALTNDRIRDEIGEISRVPAKDRLVGNGMSTIMASFTHLGTSSRFTDGSFGVCYAGFDLETATAESKFWQARQMADTAEDEMTRDMRVYTSKIQGDVSDLVDLREDERVHDPVNYSASQKMAKDLRQADEYGLVYRSVRREGGECIAALRPPIMGATSQYRHFRYHWNGTEIDRVELITHVQ